METIGILGSGWLGLPLAKFIADQSYRVKLSTRSRHRLPELAKLTAQSYVIDIDTAGGEVEDFLDVDILIINITSKNIEAYVWLIAAIERSRVRRVLFVSSTSVYKNTNGTITEQDGSESSDNELFKIETLFCVNSVFETTIIRFAGLIGYSRHPGRFFTKNSVVRQPESPVNLIHRDDCIGIINSIIKQSAWGEVLNACADTHPTKREFYSYACRNLMVPIPIFAENEILSFKLIDNSKLKRCLGYKLTHADLMKLEFES